MALALLAATAVLGACGTSDERSTVSEESPDRSSTTRISPGASEATISSSRPPHCRPELLEGDRAEPSDLALAAGRDGTLLGGPFGIAALHPDAGGSAGRFFARRTAAFVRFGCRVAAVVVGDAVASQYCDPSALASVQPDSVRCSVEVHALADLGLRAAFDIPADRRLDGSAGDRIVFSRRDASAEERVVVATTTDGEEVWSASVPGDREHVFVTAEVVVASRPWAPEWPGAVTVLDASTGELVVDGELEGDLAGVGAGGLWELRSVSVTDYGAKRAGDDGRIRVLDPRTLAVVAQSGPVLAGVRSVTIGAADAIVQIHTPDGRIELALVEPPALEPVLVAELPLADLHRSGWGTYRIVGRSDTHLLVRDYTGTKAVALPTRPATNAGSPGQ